MVGWGYLQHGGIDWIVRVARTEVSKEREFKNVSTLMDLRKIDEKDWKHVVFHRYGMMREGDTMEIIAAQDPRHVAAAFEQTFGGQYDWTSKKSEPGECVVHILVDVPRERPASVEGAGREDERVERHGDPCGGDQERHLDKRHLDDKRHLVA